MKITIDGITYDYDNTRRPMSEALAIEKAWGRRYAEWETELIAGSAQAAAVLVWLIWRREGREVPLDDLLSGKTDFDYSEMLRSLRDAGAEAEAEDPTGGAGISTAPDGTDTTPPGTRPSSRRSSTSAPGKSGSSPRSSSTP